MAKSVGARVNERIYDWLEEKADREATTKARIIEDLLLREYKEDGGQEMEKVDLSTVPQLRDLDEEPILDAEHREIAEMVRDEFGRWLAEDDDARQLDVRFASDAPDRVLRDARQLFLEKMQERA